MVDELGNAHTIQKEGIVCMYAAVTVVFDVSSMLQSWIWRVEAYAAAQCCYSVVIVRVHRTIPQLPSNLAFPFLRNLPLSFTSSFSLL